MLLRRSKGRRCEEGKRTNLFMRPNPLDFVQAAFSTRSNDQAMLDLNPHLLHDSSLRVRHGRTLGGEEEVERLEHNAVLGVFERQEGIPALCAFGCVLGFIPMYVWERSNKGHFSPGLVVR